MAELITTISIRLNLSVSAILMTIIYNNTAINRFTQVRNKESIDDHFVRQMLEIWEMPKDQKTNINLIDLSVIKFIKQE